MNEMQIFTNELFGSIRTLEENDGKVLFCGSDVAKALGYAKPQNAIATHCKGALKRGIPTNGGTMERIIISKSNKGHLIAFGYIYRQKKIRYRKRYQACFRAYGIRCGKR